MNTLYRYLPLVFIVTGCALMETIGFSTTEGQPTELATGLSGFVAGLTGIDAIGIWKTGEALFTQRGRNNLKAVLSPGIGAKDSAKSLQALLLGTDTPDAARPE